MAIYKNTPPIITNGLVFYLDAGNRQSYISGSTTWSDLSTTRAVGTLTNGPTFNSANQGSVVFNGTNQYVTIPNNSTLKPTFPFTIGLTSFPATTSVVYTFANDNSTTAYCGVALGIFGTGSYILFGNNVSVAGSSRKQFVFDTPSTQWVNVIASCTSFTNVSIYVNGVSTATTTSGTGASLVYSTNATEIGRAAYGTPTYYNGQVSNVQIYNRALLAQEAAQNYNAIKSRFGLT
jgi:hypothetical protein